MKITKTQLKQIIKEELGAAMGSGGQEYFQGLRPDAQAALDEHFGVGSFAAAYDQVSAGHGTSYGPGEQKSPQEVGKLALLELLGLEDGWAIPVKDLAPGLR